MNYNNQKIDTNIYDLAKNDSYILLLISNAIIHETVQPTLDKITKTSDNFIEKFPDKEEDNIKVLTYKTPNNTFIRHSSAARYQNGDFIPVYFDTPSLPESDMEEMIELEKLIDTTFTDIRYLMDAMKKLAFSIKALGTSAENSILILLHCLPEIVQETESVKTYLRTVEKQATTLGDIVNSDLTQYDKFKNDKLNETLLRYNAISLLTDF